MVEDDHRESQDRDLIDPAAVERCILTLRAHRVILDVDLARLYGVTTKRLNQQVRRNPNRFPEDFMFPLTAEETERLRLQIATSNPGRGGRRSLPFAFTEHGAIMAANVLNSRRAVEASVRVVRAFVRLRRFLAAHQELAKKLRELEDRIGTHDETIQDIMRAIHRLMERPEGRHRERIGFHPRRRRSTSREP